jgi:hypothetical protein
MTLHEEISDFLQENGIAHDTVTISGHSVVVAHISKDRSISIVPAPISAESPEAAATHCEALSSCIDSIIPTTGERPLIISEDRWKSQSETTRTRILAHMEIFTQIYARNCEIRKIDKKTAAEFLNANHSYGDASCRYRYGLYLKRHTGHNSGSVSIEPGCLVAVATFSNGRKWIKGDKTIRSYEWTRYASLPEVRLSGGMGRILKAFISDVQPDDIMTYADLEWSEGKVYDALGFTLEGWKPPVFFAINTDSWTRMPIMTDRTMAGVDMPPPARGCISVRSTATGVNGSHVLSVSNRFFQNLGSNKYRLKLTEY